jgi:hypothetical protein
MADISETLEERGKRYGSFIGDATVAQDLKHILKTTAEDNKNLPNGWNDLDADMKEALEMISTKMGRIVHGDPWYEDSWRDIAGYATLVADRLENL